MRSILMIMAMTLLIFGSSCKTAEKISSPTGEKLSVSKLEKRLANPVIPEEWLHSRGKLKADLPELKATGSYRMYLQRDSALWMQITKFGMEIARVLITPDSIIFLNRLESSYIKGDAGDIEEILGVPVNFNQLQLLLWGLAPVYTKESEIVSKENYFLVSGKDKMAAVSYLYSITAPFEIVSGFLEMESADRRNTQSLEFKNDDYQLITNDYYFPYLRNYHMISPQNEIKIEMSVQNVEVGESKDLQLRVPAHYESYNN